MEVKEQIKLTFHGVDIFSVQFASESPLDRNKNIDLNIVPKVFYPSDSPSEFKIIFETIVKADGFFNLSLQAVGHFSLEKDVDEKVKKSFVNANAPAIMFPYVRSFITTLTSNLGTATGPIVLPPHFFTGQLEEVVTEDNSAK
ncbi:MAG: protein-export chaperone SecB [Chitinophagales bacterium]|nr:protein-export chaperone SecB [Chitinophagales bacterium]